MVPSSNTVAEVDFSQVTGPGLSLHTARMNLENTTAEAERRMLSEHAPQAASDLGTARCDLVVFSCTSAAALLGVDGEQRLIADLEYRAGAPVVSTNAAVAENLDGLGSRRVGVLTAYVDELNAGIADSLRHRGFDVSEIHGMGLTENFAIAQVTPRALVEFAQSAIRDEAVDALFVSCTNLRAVQAIPLLEAHFGLPVVTSNSAARQVALARLGQLPPQQTNLIGVDGER